MLPFKKILCPTDFSEPACKAIQAAGELAEQFSSELILLHVVGTVPVLESPTGLAGFDVAAYRQELADAAQTSLTQRAKQYVPASVTARTLVVHGDAAHEIGRVAEEASVDLIVLSTHGESGWRHRLFGSVLEKVLRIADCPVLAVHLDT
jgi:universal stress protein A